MTIELRGPGGRQTVADPIGLDRALDRLEQELDQPALVALTNSSETLRIGLGHPSSSVALFLDTHRQPWAAQRQAASDPAGGATFVQGAVAHDFYSSAVITPAQARRAAHEFLETGSRPTSLRWAREPGQH